MTEKPVDVILNQDNIPSRIIYTDEMGESTEYKITACDLIADLMDKGKIERGELTTYDYKVRIRSNYGLVAMKLRRYADEDRWTLVKDH